VHQIVRAVRITSADQAGFQYLVHPARYLVEYLQHLAKTHNVSICGTIVEPKSHQPKQEPSVSPFNYLEDENLESNGDVWTSYIRRLYSSDEPATLSAPHAREGDDKDMPAVKPGKQHDDERVDQMINVAYVFEAGTGKAVGRYVKRNLWISERDYLTSGEEEHEVFELKGIKMGLLICKCSTVTTPACSSQS
jgi:predicted amidohydrolase